MAVERIGITGHQGLTPDTEKLVAGRLSEILIDKGPILGVTSLAEGADQIFARLVLEMHGDLEVVIPARDYETTFDSEGLKKYHDLLSEAVSVIQLDHQQSNEEAYWAAGQWLVRNSDRLIAVWNGKPAAGLGGTADVVEYAKEMGKSVLIVWPEGSARK